MILSVEAFEQSFNKVQSVTVGLYLCVDSVDFAVTSTMSLDRRELRRKRQHRVVTFSDISESDSG